MAKIVARFINETQLVVLHGGLSAARKVADYITGADNYTVTKGSVPLNGKVCRAAKITFHHKDDADEMRVALRGGLTGNPMIDVINRTNRECGSNLAPLSL